LKCAAPAGIRGEVCEKWLLLDFQLWLQVIVPDVPVPSVWKVWSPMELSIELFGRLVCVVVAMLPCSEH
jgi:hypothetical protein